MPWYVVTRLGVGIETDAFFASGALPQLIFLVASFSLTQVLVPLLATEDEKTFRRDSWAFFLGVSGFFSLLAIFLFVTAGIWVDLIVPGFDQQGRDLTITLSRIQLLAMIGNASVVVLWSVYYARQKFLWAESSSVIANAVGLVVLFWTLPRYGIAAAAWATVVTLALKVALLMPVLGAWQKPQWNSYAIVEAWRRIKPFLLGQTYAKSVRCRSVSYPLTVAGNLSLLYIGRKVAGDQLISPGRSQRHLCRVWRRGKAGEWFRHVYRQRLLPMLADASLHRTILHGRAFLRLLTGGITENVHTLRLFLLAGAPDR
jgi:putative peptidoglycan lipid II flippase